MDLQQRAEHPAAEVTEEHRFRILLGTGNDGRACEWNVRKHAHLLIVGVAGSGKTALIRRVIEQWAQRGWRTWVVDPTRTELLGTRSWPNVQRVAGRGQQMAELIRAAWEEMERRLEVIETRGSEDFEPLLLVLDAYHVMRADVQTWYAESRGRAMPARCTELALIGQLLARARSVNIHLVVSLQRSDGELLPDSDASNFLARVSLGRLSNVTAWMMWGPTYEGTDLPVGPGLGIGLDEVGRPMVMRPAWAREPRRAGSPDDRDQLHPHGAARHA